jgi:uncharacterized membrane protein
MNSNRSDLIDWSDQGRIPDNQLRAAFEMAKVLPNQNDWRRFIDRMLLFIGMTMLAVGVIFFFAFNWQGLGLMAKFALIEVPIVATFIFIWRLGVDSIVGKAILLFASLLMGALLALVGQTYQTGADTCELFIAWAAAILPWALIARFPALWLLWLALLNTAATLYFMTFGFWWSVFRPDLMLWVLFGVNTLALIAWEWLAAIGFAWLRERWAVRVIATASGGLISVLAILQILESDEIYSMCVPFWVAWLVAAYFTYRRWARDVYVLAVGVLSVIVIITVFVGKNLGHADAGLFLFIGLLVIGLSAAGGYWLKKVATEKGP